jgi:geranylgeranyl pyrophosphate synthase
MRDDVLDVIDDNSNKTRFSDLQEGNQTILLTDVLDVVSAADHDYILACRGQKLTDEQITNLLAIYRQSGAIDTTIQRIHVILQDCSHTLEESEAFSSCDTTAMQEIISVLTSIR